MPLPDVQILGAGPAGATAGRLLASWGYSVHIATGPPARRTMAECLPPSTAKVFQFLGIRERIEAAGFYRTAGNTVWWNRRKRIEPYPEGLGYQVSRSEFDALLLGLARESGARVVSVPGTTARFTLDCTGRAGVLARGLRVQQPNSRTYALCAIWHNPVGWKTIDPTHTLIESYADGWAWSVPLSPTLRHLAFMVDPVATAQLRGQGATSVYRAQLAKTRAFRRIFASGEMQGPPWGRRSSLYTARCFYGPDFLLVGDAGSTIDPLSSFGVKKAMVSAWVAAVVVNTCLQRPAMKDTALDFYDRREREIYTTALRQSASWSRKISSRFWDTLSDFAPPDPPVDEAPVRAALADLRRRRSIHLTISADVGIEQLAGIKGREIVRRRAVVAPAFSAPVDYLSGIDIPALLEIAPLHHQVPDLFEAYNRTYPTADLPAFLTALATLLAGGVLQHLPNR